MDDWKERLETEFQELTDRIRKLEKFIHGDLFSELATVQRHLLVAQLDAMRLYRFILEQRLQDIGEKCEEHKCAASG